MWFGSIPSMMAEGLFDPLIQPSFQPRVDDSPPVRLVYCLQNTTGRALGLSGQQLYTLKQVL
jgi:hypothetical protein